jgi:enoyl-CoA hydratase/carnithine racemase
MADGVVLLDVKEQVATVTLNRPERMNAWNDELGYGLSDAMRACNENDEVRAVVVTGAGRAFCAGADLGSGGDTFSGMDESLAERDQPLYPWQIDKPVIAAINGHAVGAGLTYSMMCDVRFVAEEAKLQFAFVRRGIIPELGSHVIVPRVLGFSRAADLMLSGRMIRGQEAAELGLASQALPADQVLPTALEWARDLAVNAAPVSVAISKRLLWESITVSVSQIQEREDKWLAWIGNQPDADEGVVSFLERRPPKWTLSTTRDKPDLGGSGP